MSVCFCVCVYVSLRVCNCACVCTRDTNVVKAKGPGIKSSKFNSCSVVHRAVL